MSRPIIAAVGRLPAELTTLREQVRTFLADELRRGEFTPEPDAWLSGLDPTFSRRLATRGWIGMTIPTRYGGHGRTELERFVVNEELLAAGAPVAAHWVADRQIAPALLRNGTQAQKATYLPGIAAGERFFGIGMSEPDAGSDLAAVRTRAVAFADGWRVTGTKLWTSGAHIATNLVALVRTGDASDRHGGLSQFLIDLPHPDIHITAITTIDGRQHLNEIVFDDAVLPATALLGAAGAGWRQVTAELANERSGPERLLTTLPLLQAWTSTPMPADVSVRRARAALLSRLALLREMSLAVAHALDTGMSPAVPAAIVKDLGTAFENDVVDVVRRFAGVEPDPGADGLAGILATAVLHTPAFTLRGGTTEILRSIVAKGTSADA